MEGSLINEIFFGPHRPREGSLLRRETPCNGEAEDMPDTPAGKARNRKPRTGAQQNAAHWQTIAPEHREKVHLKMRGDGKGLVLSNVSFGHQPETPSGNVFA